MILLSYLLFAVQRLWLETALIAASAPVRAGAFTRVSLIRTRRRRIVVAARRGDVCVSDHRRENRQPPRRQSSIAATAAGLAMPVLGAECSRGCRSCGGWRWPCGWSGIRQLSRPCDSYWYKLAPSIQLLLDSHEQERSTLGHSHTDTGEIYCLAYLCVEWFPHYLQYPAALSLFSLHTLLMRQESGPKHLCQTFWPNGSIEASNPSVGST